MKNIKIFGLFLVMLAAFSGCGKSDNNGGGGNENGDGTIVGQWHLISWSGTAAAADVYISFAEKGTFDLYQRVYSPEYVHYTGNYSYSDDRLSGKYSDNVAWASDYKVSFSTDGNQMTLTSTKSSTDISVYQKATIPDEILSGELSASQQSRADKEEFRFL